LKEQHDKLKQVEVKREIGRESMDEL